jgi:hypothetical protein
VYRLEQGTFGKAAAKAGAAAGTGGGFGTTGKAAAIAKAAAETTAKALLQQFPEFGHARRGPFHRLAGHFIYHHTIPVIVKNTLGVKFFIHKKNAPFP